MDEKQMQEIVLRCCEFALVYKDIGGDLRKSQVVMVLHKQGLPQRLWLPLVELLVDAIREEIGNVRLAVRPSHYLAEWPMVLEVNVQWRDLLKDSTYGPEILLQCRVEALHLPGLLILRQKIYGEKN